MKKFILKIVLISFLFGCKSADTRVIEKKIIPSWVESTPSHPDYYIGVFSTLKVGSDYRERAKRGALENLASEISVNVAGHSVLKTLETNNSFSQDYRNEVTVKSSENLAGYELAGSWSNEEEYWVYYKLSKIKYAAIKKERVQKALDLGVDYFTRAKENHDKNNYHEAFVLSIKALESVSDFLDEPLTTEVNKEKVYFGTEVLSYAQQMIEELSIVANQERCNVVLGDEIWEDNIFFTIKNNKGDPISGIPLKCEYKAVFFKTFDVTSDQFGRAGLAIGKINQTKPEQSITAELNFNELAENKSKDRIVLKLFNYLPHKTGKIKLIIQVPKVFVTSSEKEFGEKTSSKLALTAKQSLINKGFRVVDDKKEANLIMSINTDSQFLGKNEKTYLAELNGVVQVTHVKTGSIVFSEIIKPMKGLQLSKKNASKDAYSKAESYMKRRVVPKLANQYFSF
jgi:hypothetical protein